MFYNMDKLVDKYERLTLTGILINHLCASTLNVIVYYSRTRESCSMGRIVA